MSIRAIVLGASGYGGGELLRLLVGHPSVEGIQGTSRKHAGKRFWTVHPNLRGLLEEDFSAEPDWAWLAEAEHPVVFAAMPHGEFSKQYTILSEQWKQAGIIDRVTVIDLSADFRVQHLERYESHYGVQHPCPEHLADFVYGFTEQRREVLKGARRIANPGCFATAVQLGLLPLCSAHYEGFVAVSAITGSSGSGMVASDTTHHPTRAHDFRAYKMLNHQHEAEIEQLVASTGATKLEFSFVPHSAPMVRGIFATFQFKLPDDAGSKWVEERIRACYDGQPFIRLVSGSPKVAAVTGSNFADIGWAVKGRKATIMVALDNLMKGMSGEAVQNMNIALGLDEREGLWFASPYPA